MSRWYVPPKLTERAMGITFQVFAIVPETLDAFLADGDEADRFVQDRFCDDIAGESLWLDKSGMGIMEAFGVQEGEGSPPAVWIFGDDELGVGELEPDFPVPCPYLRPDQVAEVAGWIAGISDSEFRTLAASNEMDTDVDYLAHF